MPFELSWVGRDTGGLRLESVKRQAHSFEFKGRASGLSARTLLTQKGDHLYHQMAPSGLSRVAHCTYQLLK
jgi:hypothetical protein